MLKLAVALFAGELESVTFKVKLKVPVALGVPEITPVGEMVKLVGSVPELMVQV
jgi:hypothetical protein